MKNRNIKFVVGLLAIAGTFFAACHNPIIERWWGNDPKSDTFQPDNVDGGGGSGANFGAVVFDADGGTPSPRALHIAWGGTVGRLRPIEKGTYGFMGWFDENDHLWDVETRQVRPEDDVNGDGFITLKARWNPISHEVNFVTSPSPTSIPRQLIGTGGRVVAPVNPAALGDGRGFAGWWDSNGAGGDWGRLWDFARDTVNSPITLYARWEYQTRTVVLQPNGGTRPDGSALTRTHFTVPVIFGAVQDPGPIVREGYSFGGWFTGAGIPWDFATDRVTEPDVVPGENPLVIYAEWIQKVYVVSFAVRSAAASQPAMQEIPHGERVARPTVTNPGMVLVGWFKDWERTIEWNFDRDRVVSSMTLFAMWESATPPGGGGDSGSSGSGVNFGVVRFDAVGGNPNPQNLDIEWGHVVGRLRPMERGNDGFVGWFDENGEPWDTETRPVTKEDDVNGDGFISLTARWTPASYTVRFVTTPSPSIIPNQSVGFVGKVVEPLKPEAPEDGRGFAGWWDSDGTGGNWGRQWDFARDVVTSPITLYARWESRTRTVIFVPNGGTRPDRSALARNEFIISVDYGYVQDPGPLVRPGHSFGGWFEDIGFNRRWNFATDRVTEPEASPGENPFYLYARWVQNIYIVSFALRSATASPQPNTQQIPYGMRVEMPMVANPGMILTGWFTDWNLTKEWDFGRNTVSSNMILYANWEPAPSGGGNGSTFGTVTFDMDGGKPDLGDLDISWGSVIGRLPSVGKEGHGFVGWFDENGEPWDLALRPVTENDDVNRDGFVTLTAMWDVRHYRVSFNTTDSSTVIPDQLIAHGGVVVKPEKPTTGVGQSFAGWHTEDGTSDGNWGSLWSFTDRVTNDFTLYARWSGYQTRTVIFEPNGGTLLSGMELRTHFTIPVAYGVIQDPGPMVKPGYSFGGWFVDRGFNAQWDFARDRITEPDASPGANPFYLYARWIENVYTVTFDVRDSAIPNPPAQRVAHGRLATRPVIVNPGMLLVGWYSDFGRTREWNFSVDTVTSNMVLYAKWEAVISTVPPDTIIRQVRIVRVDFIDFAGDQTIFNESRPGPGASTYLTPTQVAANTATIAEVARILRDNPGFLVQLAGHANPTSQNIEAELAELEEVSRKRSDAVAREFIRQGIPESRMINVGFNPWNLNTSNDPNHASLNRCVEVIIIEILPD